MGTDIRSTIHVSGRLVLCQVPKRCCSDCLGGQPRYIPYPALGGSCHIAPCRAGLATMGQRHQHANRTTKISYMLWADARLGVHTNRIGTQVVLQHTFFVVLARQPLGA